MYIHNIHMYILRRNARRGLCAYSAFRGLLALKIELPAVHFNILHVEQMDTRIASVSCIGIGCWNIEYSLHT